MAKQLFSFDINCQNVAISPNGGGSVTVSLDNVDKTDVFDLFDVQETIDHFGMKEVLDQIGVDEVKKYFDLTESE